MKCDKCKRLIGNTIYIVNKRYLCPICWLGEEGKQDKYQKFDNPLTKEKLTNIQKPKHIIP